MIDAYFDRGQDKLRAFFGNADVAPLDRLEAYFDDRIHAFRATGFVKGCLLGNFSAEVADHSALMREHLVEHFGAWGSFFEHCIAEAQEQGTIGDQFPAALLGRFVLNSWEGALLRMRAEKSDYFGPEIDLLEFVAANKDRLVLKPNDAYGGHGISIGWNTDEIRWAEALRAALVNGDYLVQERVPTAREVFPALTPEGTINFAEQLVDLDPLLFNGKVGSAFTRLSSSELANVSSGGGMVPTFLISKK